MINKERLPDDIEKRLEKAITLMKNEKNIIFAYLFGSIARGERKPLSDLDLAVYLKNTRKTTEYKLNLITKLIDCLGTKDFDLVILNKAPISLAGRILMSRKVIVDKIPTIRHSYESLTLRQFSDFSIKESQILKRSFNIG